MAGPGPTSDVWTNPLPADVDRTLEIIFQSLTTWLSNPTFQSGITVGNGTAPTYDPTTGSMTAPAPTTVITLNSITQAPSDTSAPATPTVTVLGGFRSVLAYWTAVATANGSPVASYVAQIATDNLFASIVQTLDPVGPVASFNGLSPNTAYYVRVAGVSQTNTQGPWSATVTVTTPQASTTDIAAGTITAGSAIIGTAAISSAQIASVTADKITAGTINAQTISLGATGGTAALQSTNYNGTVGWQVAGDGSATFSSVGVPAGGVIVTSTGSGTTFRQTNIGDAVIKFGASTSFSTGSGRISGGAAVIEFGEYSATNIRGAYIQVSGGNGITIDGSTSASGVSITGGTAGVALTGPVTVGGVSITPDTAWTAVSGYTNGWADYASGTGPVGFRKVGTRVELRGAVRSGTLNASAFTLPVGYRPTGSQNFSSVANGGFAYLNITTAGLVLCGNSNVWFSLDNISFDTT